MQLRLARPRPGRRLRLQAQMGEDLLDDRPLQDPRNDPQLATAVRAILHRQHVHGFTARQLGSDDPEAVAAEYPLIDQ